MDDKNLGTIAAEKDIVNQFSIILRNAQLHNINNEAVLKAIDRFLNIVSPVMEAEGRLELDLIGNHFYINKTLMSVPLEYISNYDEVVNGFQERDIGGISFSKGLSQDDIKKFINAYIDLPSAESPFVRIKSLLEDVKTIEVKKTRRVSEMTDKIKKREMVKKTYFNAVSFTKGVMEKIKAGEKINIKQARRVVESIVDSFLEEESFLLGLTAIKDYDEYTYHHGCKNS